MEGQLYIQRSHQANFVSFLRNNSVPMKFPQRGPIEFSMKALRSLNSPENFTIWKRTAPRKGYGFGMDLIPVIGIVHPRKRIWDETLKSSYRKVNINEGISTKETKGGAKERNVAQLLVSYEIDLDELSKEVAAEDLEKELIRLAEEQVAPTDTNLVKKIDASLDYHIEIIKSNSIKL